MQVLAIEMVLDLPYAHSLKDKRAVRQSLMSKLKKNFSVSVRETDLQDVFNKLNLSVAFVCLSEAEGQEYSQRIQDFLYEFSLNNSCDIQNLIWDIEDVLISE